jgi:membrane protein DedA with SNARE-associated domain
MKKHYFLSILSSILIVALLFYIGFFVLASFIPPSSTYSGPIEVQFDAIAVAIFVVSALAGYSFFRLSLQKGLERGAYWMIIYFVLSNFLWYGIYLRIGIILGFFFKLPVETWSSITLIGYVPFTYIPLLWYFFRKMGERRGQLPKHSPSK